MTQEIESIGLGMDTSGIEKGIKALDVLAGKGAPVEKAMAQVEGAAKKTVKSLDDLATATPKAVDSVGKTATKAADGLAKVSGAADGAVKSVRNIGANTAGLDKLSSSSAASAINIKSLGAAAVASEKGVQQFVRSVSSVAQSIAAEAASMNDARAAAAAYSAQHIAAAKAMVDLQRSLSATTAAMDGMTAKAKEMAAIDIAGRKAAAGVREVKGAADESNASMLALARAGVSAFIGSAIVRGAKDAAMAMYEASASAQRLQTMLDFASGGNGAREIEYLRKVTNSLGLQFSSTAAAYGQFQAAAKGTALEGQKAAAVFESVAKASAVMGLRADQTSGVLLALQQMISKGTVQAEELRGQLGERLPGAFQIAAKAMGVTTGELGKMLEQGQVIADDFLPKFGAALEQNLGGAAEKAAERLDAAVNRFDAAWEKLKQKAGDSGVSKAVSQELSAISRDLDAVSDGMDRAGKAGGGMWAQLGSGAAIAVGRVGFSTLNLAANTLNGSINALTGGVFGLRTNLALLPDIFKTDAEYAASLSSELNSAEAKFAALQARGAATTTNIYLKDSYYQLQEYIKELKKAQAEQAKLTGVPVVGVNEGIVAQGRAREAYNTQRAKDEEAAAAFRLNLAGVPASYVKEMQELIRLNQAGIIVGKEYTDALAKQQDLLLKKTTTVRGSAAAANAEQNAYESLIASIRAKIEADNLEIAGGAALTESQRIRIKLDQDLAAGRVKLTAQNERAVRLALEELAASEASADAAKTLAKANLDAAASREKYLTSLSTGLDKIQADIAAQIEATERMGLSKQAIAALDAAKLEMLATDLELQAIKAMDRNLDQQTYDALKKQAAAYRELGIAKKGGAAKEAALDMEKANAEAAKKAQEDWERAAEQINSSLTDALLRGFESGKDFAKNLRDTVVNMFKTMVLRPIISAVVSPVAGAITGALGLAGTANAGTSALGTVGNIASGAKLLGGLGTFGGGLSAGFGGLMGSLGLNATGATLGGAMSAGSIAMGSGNILGGLGTFVGALGPIALGLGALVSLLGKKSTPHVGGGASYGADMGLITGAASNDFIREWTIPESAYRDEANKAAATMAKTISQTLDGVAKQFGQQMGYVVGTGFADDSSKDGAWGALRIALGDRTVADWGNPDDKWAGVTFADGEAGAKEYAAKIASTVREVLNGMDLPGWASRIAKSMPADGTMDDLTQVLATISAYPAQLLQQFGTSRDALVQQFAQGLATGDAAAAGQSVADTLVQSIQNAVFTNAAGQLFDIVNQGIVTPVLDAMANGAALSEALSEATIQGTIDRAKEQAQKLAELYGNEEFRSVLDTLRTTVGSALGGAGGYIQSLPNTLAATQAIDSAAQSAAQAAEDARKKWQDITDGLLSDRFQADMALLRALGREEEAVAQERLRAIEGYDEYQISLYDGTQAILGQVAALERQAEAADLARQKAEELAASIASELPAVLDKYRTPDQRVAAGYDRIAADLGAAGINVSAQTLMAASKDQIAQAAMAVYNLGTTSDEMRLALIRAASGLADLKDQAADAAKAAADAAQAERERLLQVAQSATDAAYSALEREVNARRTVVQDTISDVRSVFDAVGDAARSLYGDVGSTSAMMGAQGQAFIDQALSNARLTGYLPDPEELRKAIAAATGDLGKSVFASKFEEDRSRLLLAGKLSDLESISGDQLTEAEKQLASLDGILENARQQIDALRGIDNSVLGVDARIAMLTDAILAETTARAAVAGGGGGGVRVPSGAVTGAASVLNGPGGSQYDPGSGMFYAGGTGLPYLAKELGAAAIDMVNAGQARDVYDVAVANGVTSDMLAAWTGANAQDLRDWAKTMGLPSFAVGINRVPYDMPAMLHKDELVVPERFNPFNPGAQQWGNAEVVAELRAVREQLAATQAELAAIREHTKRTSTAVNGNPDQPAPTYITNKVKTVAA